MENSMEGPQKPKNRTTLWYSNSTPGYLSGKMKTLIQKDIYNPMFIAALLTTPNIWKQSKCLWTDEWIKKKWYIYAMEYYSAMKKNEILSFATTWMDPEGIMFSEISWTEKGKHCVFTYMWNLKNKTDEWI